MGIVESGAPEPSLHIHALRFVAGIAAHGVAAPHGNDPVPFDSDCLRNGLVVVQSVKNTVVQDQVSRLEGRLPAS